MSKNKEKSPKDHYMENYITKKRERAIKGKP